MLHLKSNVKIFAAGKISQSYWTKRKKQVTELPKRIKRVRSAFSAQDRCFYFSPLKRNFW